jgi:putative membrane protein
MSTGDQPERGSGAAPQVPELDVRQQLAADRTLLAWIRTAIAVAALGFVVARFNLFLHEVHEASPKGSLAARVIGLALVAAAGVGLLLGVWQYQQVARLLSQHGDPLVVSRWPAATAAVVVLLGIVALVVYLATGVH